MTPEERYARVVKAKEALDRVIASTPAAVKNASEAKFFTGGKVDTSKIMAK